MNADRISEVKRLGVAAVARAFGATVSEKMGVSPCPSCGATIRVRRTARRNAPPVNIKADTGAVFFCFECEEGGSAFDFAAYSILGHRAERADVIEVVRECAARGLCSPVAGDAPRVERGPARESTVPTSIEPASPPPLPPPPVEVAATWRACVPVNELPTESPARAYLSSRNIDSGRLASAGDMVRAMPTELTTPAWWPAAWRSTWPLVFPAYDATGDLASLHARAITIGAEPKTRWPRGCSLGGVLFADSMGRDFLRLWRVPEQLAGLEAVVVAEGATDTLKVAQVLEGSAATWGVLGYVSGSKQALGRITWPAWLPCLIAVDDDPAGDAYACEIRQALHRALVYRVRAPISRMGERKAADWTDLDDTLVRETLANVARWEVLP